MDISNALEFSMGMTGLVSITVVLLCIGLSWWALQQFRFDLFVKQPRSAPAKMLQVLLSIALGYQIARFVLDYYNWSTLLKGMF
ncbi:MULTISPECIES: DUF1146 family protein [Paenibacillus]|jgi:uncharacterized integral membrane protein (TIGR02327 family)|uniref:DUF1146 domain-containing protein n=1 Tax=Paenibacillus oceani TaxID=2772510 RepID=A0A927CA24_9BACL|nr:DUF1146 family protein [Paenibacillus oceani]MBD2863604.1 DUF1146 domain-containing protein [Paenibacillus oceani]MDF2659218.1 hypothetical protein [Paenibacillus sp.]